LAFINPRPTSGWITSRYAYCGEQYCTEPSKLASDFTAARHDLELAVLGDAEGSLLDVGCATGAFVAAARAAGFDARGVDVSAPSTRYGRDVLGLPLDVGDIYERRYPSERFNVVTLWATLEHLIDPARVLSEAHRVLTPDGIIAVSVPNYASLTQRVLGQRNRYVGVDHVNYFTAYTLSKLLARHRFRVERSQTDRFNPIVLWQDLRGATLMGASLERQLSDQRLTDRFKYDSGAFALARVGHRIVTSLLGAMGLADMLYVVARKEQAR
jgi:2-polyprenyl-3-methyl-5-hydroxy-6-metoxy-1,4-benzoquinol methylase